jgi:hypothetical protein
MKGEIEVMWLEARTRFETNPPLPCDWIATPTHHYRQPALLVSNLQYATQKGVYDASSSCGIANVSVRRPPLPSTSNVPDRFVVEGIFPYSKRLVRSGISPQDRKTVRPRPYSSSYIVS